MDVFRRSRAGQGMTVEIIPMATRLTPLQSTLSLYCFLFPVKHCNILHRAEFESLIAELKSSR